MDKSRFRSKWTFAACFALLMSSLLLGSSATAESSQVVIPVGKHPFSVAFESTTNRIFVANYESSYVTIIDAKSDKVISQVQVGPSPEYLSVLSNANIVYVTHKGNDISQVSAIDASDGSLLKTLDIGGNIIGLAANPITNKVYVALENYPNGAIFVIDAQTNEVADRIPVGNASQTLSVNPKTNEIFMLNGGSGPTFVINATDLSVVAKIATSLDQSPGGLVAVNPAKDLVYLIKKDTRAPPLGDGVSIPSGILFIIDGKNDTVISNTTLVAPSAIAVDEVRNIIYVTNSWNNILYVINGTDGNISGQIKVGEGPGGIAVNAATGQVLVANSRSNTISVIDDAARIPEFPFGLMTSSVAIAVAIIVIRPWKFHRSN